MLDKLRRHSLKLGIAVQTLLISATANASSTGMPWEDPLSRIVDSITGPVAFGASVLGIVVAGATLIFGGQLDSFVQKIMILALVISIIVGATNLLSVLFGTSSTLVM
ncbi:TrbC/VirB2 family protein [Vibrio harveyi]|uniref:TrbC/VirB2 family protein n=1 Tax=Vibrio harveyi TaxID=669 RepID=UPI000347919D|nr:TrbC/VirB2 family protein [Vibrio harveyi]